MPKAEKDKRYFRRYSRHSNFNININGKIFEAKTVDYSLKGVGAIVDNATPISKGAVIDLDIGFPHIRTKGEIVWTRRSNSGLLIGIKRLDFQLKGCLGEYLLSDLLMGIQRSEKTGVIEIKSGSVVKRIYVNKGDMIFSESNQNEDRMGEILLRNGNITIEQYNHSGEILKRTGKKQGTILVELGYIKPQSLVNAVRYQVEKIIISLFDLEDCDFEFKEAPLPADHVITLKLSAANLIYQGIKKMNKPEKIFNLLQLPMDTVLCFSSDPLNLFQDIALDTADRKIISYIDGKTTIKEIISLSPIKDSETLKSLYALLSTKIIDIKGEDESVSLSADDVIRESEVEIDEEFMQKLERIYDTYESLGYYGILGIKEWALPDDIKRAYYISAKEFHPDRHFNLKSDAVKEKLNEIFSYITTAYAILSDPQKKRVYDNSLSNKPSGVLSNQETAKSKFEEGKREFRKGNYSEAFQLFGQAVYLDNIVADYHYHYGLALVNLQRFKEAERAINRALERSPFNINYITEMGYIYLQLGFMHRAKSTFEKAIKIDPCNNRAIEGLRMVQK